MKKKRIRIKHIIFILVACYIGYTLVNQELMMSRLRGDIREYTEQNKKVEEMNSYIADQIEYAKTDEYKEKMARERIGLIKPGETVYIIEFDE